MLATRIGITSPLTFSDEQGLLEAFHSNQRVGGLTHRFYSYPARFNPVFARHVIRELSEPGDTVLDPFMGGGTTIVEAVAAGRRAIGIDINGLSRFVARIKTTPLSERDAAELLDWGFSIEPAMGAASVNGRASRDQRTKNLPENVTPFFDAALYSLKALRFPRQRRFARGVLLRVGQWALDCRKHYPANEELLCKVVEETRSMLTGLREFERIAKLSGINKNKITGNRLLLEGSVTDPGILRRVGEIVGAPKLVLTSPPYPGVHILYHRWQVLGRRETPAPYWLANLQDGHGASHYTMGSRSTHGLQNYFTVLRRGFEGLKRILSSDTIVVQLVAFSETKTQLPLYMDAIAAAGYEEVRVSSLRSNENYVRTVPNRRWYSISKSGDADREVLMFHRPRPN